MPSEAEVLFDQAAAWRAQGKRVALATVIKTWGSSPRPPGSMLFISDGGAMAGSVSGGCIEGAVVHAALESLKEGTPRLLEFGVTSEMAWEVGLACGGQVQVFVAPLPEPGAPGADLIETLRRDLRERRPFALLTTVPSGERRLYSLPSGADEAPEPLAQAARDALLHDRFSEHAAESGQRVLVQPFCPPVRVIIVGAVHIAQPLAQMAALAGFEVHVIDPRRAFATSERFPGVALHTRWPAPALSELGVDARCAVITLTHDPKLDDPALDAALHSGAFYVGALGSGKTHAARLGRLRSRGFDDAALQRIHGPVGLPLGGRAPAEIAVAILAQLIAELHRERT
jgi:xanthine dehydrogenase accessory factor